MTGFYSCQIVGTLVGSTFLELSPPQKVKKDFAFPPLAGLAFRTISNPVCVPLRVLITEAVGAISEEISGSYKVWDLICYLMINWILWPGFILLASGS